MTGTLDHHPADDAFTRGPESTISSALADLDDGCCVLVTGDVPDDAYRVAASRYFGTPHRRRHRVLAFTPGADDPTAWLPQDVAPDDDDTAVVRLDGSVRAPADGVEGIGSNGNVEGIESNDGGSVSATTPDRIDLDAAGDGGGDGGTDADEVRTALIDAIDDVVPDDRDGRLALRVGVYRIDTLCAAVGSDQGLALLRTVARTTRERGGMAHFHLPRPATGGAPRSDPVVDEVADSLGETLDVIVELRSRERSAVPEERWHIRGWGTSEWNPLR